MPDLTRVKSGSACPPLGRCYRAHPPGQALPNFQPSGSPQPPLASGLRLQPIGPINLPLADCSDGPLAPGFHGLRGRSEASGFMLPPPPYTPLFLAKFDTRQIRQHLPALGQVLPNLRPSVSSQPPLPFARALGQSGRSTCHWQIAQTVLWHPTFGGGGGSGASNHTPPSVLLWHPVCAGSAGDLRRLEQDAFIRNHTLSF